MSEMIERVAKAIEQGTCGHCGKPAVGSVTWLECEKTSCWWKPNGPEDAARAAIAAMREPTPAMVEIGVRAIELANANTIGLKFTDMLRAGVTLAWQVAVDTALKDTQPVPSPISKGEDA